MSFGYNYQEERPRLFTEEGMALTLKMKTQIDFLLKTAGAFKADAAYKDCCGLSSWTMLAVLDYFVETKWLMKLSPPGTWGQHTVYAERDTQGRL